MISASLGSSTLFGRQDLLSPPVGLSVNTQQAAGAQNSRGRTCMHNFRITRSWRSRLPHMSWDVDSIQACRFAQTCPDGTIEPSYLVRWADTWIPETLLASPGFPFAFAEVVDVMVETSTVSYLVRWEDSWHFESDLCDASVAIHTFHDLMLETKASIDTFCAFHQIYAADESEVKLSSGTCDAY